MTKAETINFMERIKSHYQEFIVDDFKIKEWHSKLKDYDLEDVNKKLDEHLNSEVYGDNIPKLYYLTKFLKTTEEKKIVRHYTLVCPQCRKELREIDFEPHYRRCGAALTIVKDFRKYLGRELSKSKIMELSDEKFEKLYMEYVDRMLECDKVESFRKKILLHIKYPNYEGDDINEIVKSMVN